MITIAERRRMYRATMKAYKNYQKCRGAGNQYQKAKLKAKYEGMLDMLSVLGLRYGYKEYYNSYGRPG